MPAVSQWSLAPIQCQQEFLLGESGGEGNCIQCKQLSWDTAQFWNSSTALQLNYEAAPVKQHSCEEAWGKPLPLGQFALS